MDSTEYQEQVEAKIEMARRDLGIIMGALSKNGWDSQTAFITAHYRKGYSVQDCCNEFIKMCNNYQD